MKKRTVAVMAALTAACCAHARELTWTGSESSEWNTTARNWTDADGNATVFEAGDSANFTVAEGSSLTIEIGSDLTVSNAVFDVAGEMTVTTNLSATAIKNCCMFVKRGAGTLTVDGKVNSSTNAVVVEAGVLRGGGQANNIRSGFGDAQTGYSVEVMPGAKFWVWSRNTLGGDNSQCNVDIIVHTNGVFSTKLRPDSGDTFSINSVRKLLFDGGTMELPENGHGSGFLRISELMSFAGLTPYLFTAEVDTQIIRLMGEQVEFRVPDITGAASGAAAPDALDDVVFDLPIAASKDKVEGGARFGLVKTGAGKMKVSRYAEAGNVVPLNGDLTVREGVLEIAGDVKLTDYGADGGIFVNTNATLVLNKNALSSLNSLTSNEFRSVTVDHGKLVFDNGGDSATHIAFGDLTLDHAELDMSNWLPNVNYGQMSFHGKVTLRGDEPFVFTCHTSTVNTTVSGRIGFAGTPRRTEFDVPDITGDAAPDCIVSNTISQQRLHADSRWITAGLIKRGAGSMVLCSQKNEFSGDIDVYEGELWAGPDEQLNEKGYLGQMVEGRTVTVHPGATLYLPNRNLFGAQGGITNTAPLGTFVIGGTLKTGPKQGFILPDITITNGGQIARGYGPDNYGRFMVREKFKVTGNAPFIWEAEKTDAGESNTRWDPVALALNGYPENVFEIDDVTGDGAADATFGVPFIIAYGYFRTDSAAGNHMLDDWKFGFTKTGAGTMRITAGQHVTVNTKNDSGFSSRSFNGDAKVAAGTLRVDGDLSLSDTVRVASGAYLAGTGVVNNVSISEGGGLKVSASQRDRLRIEGNLSVGENVVIDVDLPAGADIKDVKAGVFTVSGEITGAGNLASASLCVNGVPEPLVGLFFDGASLRVRYRYGTVMTVR